VGAEEYENRNINGFFGRAALMNAAIGHRALLMRVGKILAFAVAILLTTKLSREFGALANASTAAFCFLIIVLLSAFFGDLLVAITTSLAAMLCFDYFFLPPVGTFTITAFSDWISLAAFLLASVIISRLTAAAAENKVKANVLAKTLVQLKEFGAWLLSLPQDRLTLSGIAGETLKIFSLEYCSIHVYGEGKWRHFTGSAGTNLSQEIENGLKFFQDHPTELMELVDENMLGVRYMRINKGTATQALLAVKSRTLPAEAIETIAYMIGVRLNMKDQHLA
jgi:two-component system sensor histidine kinase KdpD